MSIREAAQLPTPSTDPEKEGRLDDMFKSVIEQAPPYLSEILKASAGLAGDMIAVAAPHLASLILTYRQKRAERNMALLFKELQNRSSTIEDRLSKLEESMRQEVRDRVFPALLDFVFDEREENKVPLFAAGFSIALKIQREPGPSLLFMQYTELLAQLSEVEVHVLSDMIPKRGSGPFREDLIPGRENYLEKRGLTRHSFDLILEKLHRLALLDDENEKKLAEQLELHDKVLAQLASKRPTIRSSTRDLGFYSKPYSSRFHVNKTGETLLSFCEIKSNLD